MIRTLPELIKRLQRPQDVPHRILTTYQGEDWKDVLYTLKCTKPPSYGVFRFPLWKSKYIQLELSELSYGKEYETEGDSDVLCLMGKYQIDIPNGVYVNLIREGTPSLFIPRKGRLISSATPTVSLHLTY